MKGILFIGLIAILIVAAYHFRDKLLPGGMAASDAKPAGFGYDNAFDQPRAA